MIDIEQLGDDSYITDNIDEIYDTHKVLTLALDKFKSAIKETGENLDSSKYNIKLSMSSTLEPVDINRILEVYPIDKFQNIYTIKLAKGAGDIITEPELLQEKSSISVLFSKK